MPPPEVLAAYLPAVRGCRWVPLPPGGGLNGGRVWRGERDGEPLFAMKCWPVSLGPRQLHLVHERMTLTGELPFVPRRVNTLAGTTAVEHAGRCWDVTTWLPGTPDLLASPSLPQLHAAGEALAALHAGWLPAKAEFAPCALIARRLDLLAEWERTRFHFTGTPEAVRELTSTLEVVLRHLTATRSELRAMASLRGRVVPVHGDYWPENVLFQQERVSGVIDFGMTTADHPEVDLGRLLADVPGIGRTHTAAAVGGYNAHAAFALSEPLVTLLAESGRVCSLANWHLRLTANSPDVGLVGAALPRVRRLVSLITAAGVSGP